MPESIKLYHRDTPWCDPIRLCFYFSNISYEDIRDSRVDDLLAERDKFGLLATLPILEVDGERLSGMRAIATYVGKLTSRYPSDPFAQAKVDEALHTSIDILEHFERFNTMEKAKAEEVAVELLAPGGKLEDAFHGLEQMVIENYL